MMTDDDLETKKNTNKYNCKNVILLRVKKQITPDI